VLLTCVFGRNRCCDLRAASEPWEEGRQEPARLWPSCARLPQRLPGIMSAYQYACGRLSTGVLVRAPVHCCLQAERGWKARDVDEVHMHAGHCKGVCWCCSAVDRASVKARVLSVARASSPVDEIFLSSSKGTRCLCAAVRVVHFSTHLIACAGNEITQRQSNDGGWRQ